MIKAGIDCGAKNTKAIIMQDGKIIGLGKALTDFGRTQAVDQSLTQALKDAGISRADINKAVHESMAGRIVSIIRRIGVNEDVAMLGGVGNNPGFMAAMQQELGVTKIYVPDKPELDPPNL